MNFISHKFGACITNSKQGVTRLLLMPRLIAGSTGPSVGSPVGNTWNGFLRPFSEGRDTDSDGGEVGKKYKVGTVL